MNFGLNDTTKTAEEILIAGYRQMTPQQKLQQITALTQTVQQLALARIRKQYGNISEQEQRLRLADLWLDTNTMIRVFRWDPEKEGY